jgi:small subunit ribosomal protein S1
MSKELIKASQYRTSKSHMLAQEDLVLSAEQNKELDELYSGILEGVQKGKPIFAKVVRVEANNVVVDINYKSDGVIDRIEFSDFEFKRLKAGDEIEVLVDELESADGSVILSYEKAKALRAWDEIIKLFEEGKPVEGAVTHKVKGGLSVDIGIPAFLPGSQIDLQRVTDFDQYVGQTVTANIIKVNKKRGNVIISRRKFMHEQRADSRKKILEKLNVGETIQGIVKNITNYGAFIDIGGVDGLLHITDMTWGRIAHPSELLRLGETITVKVLSFDKDNEKISLGLKQLTGNPWSQLAATITVGSKIKGSISSITDYGLFVEVEKGVEGLVHISEISWTDRISNLADKYKVGQEIEALVVSLDKDNRRMSLSVKQLEKNPWDAIKEQFNIGDKVKGIISNITDFGIFVQLLPGVDGLVHISDLSWTEHIDHPADVYKKGDSIEAVILSIDKDNKKISLGVKQLADDPWKLIEEQYPAGSLVEGEVSKTTNFGAFIKLPSGIEGLVHISELSDENVEKVEDILKVGEKRQFRVINVNKDDRKLGLSLRLDAKAPRESFKKTPKEGEVAKPTAPRRQQPVVAAPQREETLVQQQSKQKSQFQLALEEHAARGGAKDEDKE